MTQDDIDFYTQYANYAHLDTMTGLITFPTIRKFWANVDNTQLWPKGTWPGFIVAKATDPSGQNITTLYNAFNFVVSKGGSGGDSNQNPFIVFSSYRDNGHATLWVHTLNDNKDWEFVPGFKDSSNVWSDQLEPCVSKDNTKVAFVSSWNLASSSISDFELYWVTITFPSGVPTVGGGIWNEMTNDTYDERTPDFSPDGTKIAYVTYQSGQYRHLHCRHNEPVEQASRDQKLRERSGSLL